MKSTLSYDVLLHCLQVELTKIARLYELKSAECSKVRKLARSLLTARTDIEQHFLHSLNQAKDDLSYQL